MGIVSGIASDTGTFLFDFRFSVAVAPIVEHARQRVVGCVDCASRGIVLLGRIKSAVGLRRDANVARTPRRVDCVRGIAHDYAGLVDQSDRLATVVSVHPIFCCLAFGAAI